MAGDSDRGYVLGPCPNVLQTVIEGEPRHRSVGPGPIQLLFLDGGKRPRILSVEQRNGWITLQIRNTYDKHAL